MKHTLNRRRMLKIIGVTPFASSLTLTGCSDGSDGPTSATQEIVPWASGGTDLITVGYPGDEIFESSNTCEVSLIERLIEGPCYFEDSTGEDISEGEVGLPMQVCLRVIDSECNPLVDHIVELWHCDTRGVYSADRTRSTDGDRFFTAFCTGGDEAALTSSWYRGTLRTDGSGRVNFKTCFPGWYPTRTIHFHVSVADGFGNNRFVTQLCFTDELAEEICTTHEHYLDRGVQAIPLASGLDIEFPDEGYEPFVMSTRQNRDGSLLAYHQIQIV